MASEGFYPLDKSNNYFTFLSEVILAGQGLAGRCSKESKLLFLLLQKLFLSDPSLIPIRTA